jgi:hypothetical protein
VQQKQVATGEMAPYVITIGTQNGWFHDEGCENGVFNTFDSLDLSPCHAKRKVHIFLPRDYQQPNFIPRCVVYTNDGQDVFFAHDGAQSLQFATTLNNVMIELTDQIEHAQFLQPIVVAIHADENRDHDYTHEEVVEYVGGGLNHYTSYICDVCISQFLFSISTISITLIFHGIYLGLKTLDRSTLSNQTRRSI